MSDTAPQPWMKFYVQDWMCSERLKSVSLAAQGLWITLICIMHRSPKYGYLARETPEGIKPLDVGLTCRLTGLVNQEVSPLWQELLKWGVMKQDEEGFVFSKRMVDLHRKSLIAKENGSHGGNPRLTGLVNQVGLPSSDSESKISLSEGESEREGVFKDRLGSIYNRRKATSWSHKEIKALRLILGRPDSDLELEEMVAYYSAKGKTEDAKYLRHDLQTLLNNWSGEIDRSRKWKSITPKKHNYGTHPTFEVFKKEVAQ